MLSIDSSNVINALSWACGKEYIMRRRINKCYNTLQSNSVIQVSNVNIATTLCSSEQEEKRIKNLNKTLDKLYKETSQIIHNKKLARAKNFNPKN